MEYSQEQARIGKLLLEGPSTPQELAEELERSSEEVEEDLEEMVSLGVVKKVGGRYCLSAAVRRAFMEEEKSSEQPSGKKPFKAHIIVEGQSKSKQKLEEANQYLIDELRKDRLLKVSNFNEEEIIKDEDTGRYLVFFECDVETKRFEDLMYCVLNYGPSSIELEKPEEFTLERGDAQGLLMDVASLLHSYVGVIGKLKEDQDLVIK